MGKTKYCTYCLEFYREQHGQYWGGSNRVVEIAGCSKCQERHGEQTYKLKADLKKLQQDLDFETRRNEVDLAMLKENNRLDLLNQKAFYDDLNEKLTLELNNIKEENHRNVSKIAFLKTRRDCNHGDVIISVSDARIFAHRTILAGRSPVFGKLLQSEGSETETKEKCPLIELDWLPPAVLEAIVDFCYSGEIIYSETVPPHEVLKAAHTFRLGYLSELTEAELCRWLTVDNVPQMLKLARDYSAPRLQNEAGKLFKTNFDILSSKVYEVLQGPNNVSTSALQSIPVTCAESEDQLEA